MEGFRIHPAGENLSTVLDPKRPDGWVADDESYETQPYGVSAAASLSELAQYVSAYSMNISRGDQIMSVQGSLSTDRGRDEREIRIVVDSYEDLGPALPWLRAYTYELSDLETDVEDGTFSEPKEVAKWLRRRLDEGGIYDVYIEYRRDVMAALETKSNPPYSGWRKGWAEKPLPKDIYRACFKTKTDALNVFLDHNRRLVDDYGGENMVHSRASFDALNSFHDIPRRRQVDTIAKAVWWALPGPGPWCLEDIDVEILNRTAPAIYNQQGRVWTLPDHIEEARLVRQEEEYWREAYGGVEYPDDEVTY